MDLDRYEVRFGVHTLGYIDVVGAIFVVLRGDRYTRAVEIAQTLVFDHAVTSLRDEFDVDVRSDTTPIGDPVEQSMQTSSAA